MRNIQLEYLNVLSLGYYNGYYDNLSAGQKKILYFDWAPIIEQEMFTSVPILLSEFYFKYRLKMKLTPLRGKAYHGDSST